MKSQIDVHNITSFSEYLKLEFPSLIILLFSFATLCLVLPLYCFHIFLCCKNFTTYIYVKQSGILKIFGNPYTKGSLISNLFHIYFGSINPRVEFQSKIKKEVDLSKNLIGCVSSNLILIGNLEQCRTTNFRIPSDLLCNFNNQYNMLMHKNNSLRICKENFDKISLKSETPLKLSRLNHESEVSKSQTCRIRLNLMLDYEVNGIEVNNSDNTPIKRNRR